MSRDIYVYKIVADNGGAPCVWRGLLSLALCKPKIRKSADCGSLVFGFGGKAYKERLIYIAEVTEKPDVGVYYRSARFVERPDCIYKDVSGVPRRKRNARFHKHSDERRKDVGLRFQHAYVLLSRNFRYLGKIGTEDYKNTFAVVKRLVEGLTQGHRVHHSQKLHSELVQLKKDVWRRYRKMKMGSPTDADTRRVCNRNTSSIQC